MKTHRECAESVPTWRRGDIIKLPFVFLISLSSLQASSNGAVVHRSDRVAARFTTLYRGWWAGALLRYCVMPPSDAAMDGFGVACGRSLPRQTQTEKRLTFLHKTYNN